MHSSVCLSVCLSSHVYVRIHICLSVSQYECMYARMYVCMYASCVCMHACMLERPSRGTGTRLFCSSTSTPTSRGASAPPPSRQSPPASAFVGSKRKPTGMSGQPGRGRRESANDAAKIHMRVHMRVPIATIIGSSGCWRVVSAKGCGRGRRGKSRAYHILDTEEETRRRGDAEKKRKWH